MKLFFGKIKSTVDNKQIENAYYETLSPMKLGELEVGNYAFIISGKYIHLWKAKDKQTIDGKIRMNFEEIFKDLPLSSQSFVAFKYFKLDSSLIVLTIRQSPKAFYPIELADPSFSEAMLLDRTTYENGANFREINVLQSEKEVEKESINVQLYFDSNKHLELVNAAFLDPGLLASFRDNLSKEGKRKLKDSALRKIKAGLNGSISLSYKELPILRMYDALFTDYESIADSKTIVNEAGDELEDEDLSQPSLELKSFNQIYFGPPGTGKTYLVRKNFCLDEEVTGKTESSIKLDSSRNFWHLAPGRSGYLWNDLKKGTVLGYEWVDKSWGDLKKLTPKDVEEKGSGNYQLISYLRYVKKGDYICVISGRQLLGIAEVTEEYNYQDAIKNEFLFQTVPIQWLKKFEHSVFLNSTQTRTFVRLNEGARWSTLLTVLKENGFYFDDRNSENEKVFKPKNYIFTTFHQSFSYEDFVEGIKPVLYDSDEGGSETLSYELVPGIFYEACEKAALLAGYGTIKDCLADSKQYRKEKFKSCQEFYLIIDEVNRGNVAAIFGELITLIEDDKRLGADHEIIATLPYSKQSFGVPLNLRIVATMNTADRSVEALDTALRRRFSFDEVLPDPKCLEINENDIDIDFRRLLEVINDRLEKLLGRDQTIGHAFLLKINDMKSLRIAFCNKIIPLLQEYFYNDYAKIGLVIGSDFLEIKENKAVFMKVANYDSSDFEEKTIYALKNLDNIDDLDFQNMLRRIYG